LACSDEVDLLRRSVDHGIHHEIEYDLPQAEGARYVEGALEIGARYGYPLAVKFRRTRSNLG
jgi:hypothetical protein